MTATSLFNIILKVLGIYFIKDIILAVPTMLSVVYAFSADLSTGFSALLMISTTMFVYALVIYYLVFRTELVIEKLQLLRKIPEDPIPFNIHRSTMISIGVVTTGLILVTQGIPYLVRELAKWYQYRKASQGLFDMTGPFDYSMLLLYAAQIAVGFLFIGNARLIVNFIEWKQRRKDR